MLPHRVGFLRRFSLKTGIHLAHFGLESGMVFGGTTGVMNVIIVSIPNELERKRNMRIPKGFRECFCLGSKLINDNIISAWIPGLKTGMDFRSLVWKRVWKITFFWSDIGSRFGEQGGTPPPRIPRSTPPGLKTQWTIRLIIQLVENVMSWRSVQVLWCRRSVDWSVSFCFLVIWCCYIGINYYKKNFKKIGPRIRESCGMAE